MNEAPLRFLLTYATRYGSTREVAEAIARALREAGEEVDVRPAGEVTELEGYHVVIVGSPLYLGGWLPDATGFLRAHREHLARMPVAIFSVCGSLTEDTSEQRAYAMGLLQRVRRKVPEISPVEVGLFGGVVQRRRLRLGDRIFVWASHTPDGDWRDWGAIRSWAERVRTRLRDAAG